MKLMLCQPLEDLRELRDGCASDLDEYAQTGDAGLRSYVAETRIILALVNAEIASRLRQP